MKNDLTGKKFNNLLVIGFEKVVNTNSHWNCKCLICGSMTVVSRPNLRSGNTTDCGCMKSQKISEASTTHGDSNSPTWNSWSRMRRRLRMGSKHSPIYGKIGIQDSWSSFSNFLSDMGERPKGMTLDRIDNTKGYFKENCRWATQAEQNRNRSTNVIINFDGKSLCIVDWALEIGVHRSTIERRIKKNLPIEEILKGKK
jgi:hypothetical protein